MSTTFKRKIEDFVCEHCGKEVIGNGYTNHCPACLWSKHVDINPGDREAICGGLMQPISSVKSGGDWYVVQKCLKCSHERRNKVQKEDSFDAMILITSGK